VNHTLRSEKQVDNQVLMPSNPTQHNPTQAFWFHSLQFRQVWKRQVSLSGAQAYNPISK